MNSQIRKQSLRALLLIVILAMISARHFAQTPSNAIEAGSFKLHLLLHEIGTESYELKHAADGDGLVLSATSEFSDRGMKRSTSATLQMKADLQPMAFESKRTSGNAAPATDSVNFASGAAAVHEADASQTFTPENKYFVGFGMSPVAVQMMMVRYWAAHGKPASLPILRAVPGAPGAEISPVGSDIVTVDGKSVTLTRYTIGNILFGREVAWMNSEGQLAALTTFAGGLPFEAVRSEFEPALPQLFHAGVTQQMQDLAAIQRHVPPEKMGTFAIAGATLVDGTGSAAVPDSIVIVRDGRVAAVGTRGSITIPTGTPVVNASGETLLPGLWEMHIHYSGVEFGPALLAAGVTTARDCGGEFEFLTTVRDDIAQHHGLGPRMLLAGLVDTSGPAGFGAVTADTPDEGRAVVDRYHSAGFVQMKLYTYLKPDVVKAITAEAHRVGMSVTGHVPAALTTNEGVEDGMDQINHLNYVSRMMRPQTTNGNNGAAGGGNNTNNAAIDVNSAEARGAIQFLLDHHTVVDPTASWGEMAGHSKDMDVASFEPGILNAPYALSTKYIAMGAPETDSARVHARLAESLAVIGALYRAGVPIVAGSDTGLVGFGLDREIEIYAQAGMPPMAAIQAATLVSARAMKLDKESGTIEVGKRADLILVNGNPLQNISDIRKVTKVVTNGWLYDSIKLRQSVGFKR
jgi:imidazolonepropionase-like amidohydrolase